jgi:3-deoxy-D-manno-octulosonic-acid transferase
VYDAAQIFKMTFELLVDQDRLKNMSQAARRFAENEGGATQNTLELLLAILD